MSAFDRWIVIDWSAASRPVTGPNSIWVADVERSGRLRLDNPPTRHDAAELLIERLSSVESDRVLIGLDASLGLPRGAGALLRSPGTTGPEWRTVWDAVIDEVDDHPDNSNNRFFGAARLNQRLAAGDETRPGPFWGHPRGFFDGWLSANRPDFPWGDAQLPEYRICESRLRARGHRVQSTWKAAYQASVGGQFLTAVGWIERLRAALPRLAVWPFETGFGATPSPGDLVIGELWPGEFDLLGVHRVKDADQVHSAAMGLRQEDLAEGIESWLAGPPDAATSLLAWAEEGWPLSPALQVRLAGELAN